jgi:hypothetical protein
LQLCLALYHVICERTPCLDLKNLLCTNSRVASFTMSEIKIIRQWKAWLGSNDRESHLQALIQIVDMFNSVEQMEWDQSKLNKLYILLINSDIFTFINERIMSYNAQSNLSLIIKIICHVSEVEDFYQNGFIQSLKGFQRVLYSLPINGPSEPNLKFYQDILMCVGLILKRCVIEIFLIFL